jgi:hypothetical protein
LDVNINLRACLKRMKTNLFKEQILTTMNNIQ